VLKGRAKNFIVLSAAVFALVLAVSAEARAGDAEDVLRRIPLKGMQNEEPEKKEVPLPAGASHAAAHVNAPAVHPFLLKSVTIEGATVFGAAAFRAAYADYLMRTVGANELARIAEDITKVYREAGYFLSRAIIPAQDIADGRLRIQIVEGYIGAVVIDGDAPELAPYADALIAERPAQLATLERTLYLMGDVAGIRFKASRMAPDGDDMARHKLIVTANRIDYDAMFYSDNRGKPEAGEMEELQFGEVNYLAALGYDGATMTLNASISRNDQGDAPPGLANESESTRFFGQLSYPVIRSREQSLWIHGGIEKLHIRNEVAGALSYQDDLAIVHVAATLRQAVWDGLATIYLEIADGFAKAPTVAHSHADADGRFLKVFAQATMVEPLGDGFSVFAEVDGQVSDQPLFSAAEFALGGSRIGRGYDTGEIAGEDGGGGVIELRYDRKVFELLAAQPYVFYDAGIVWNDNAPAGAGDAALNSAGAGVRLSLPYQLYLSYEAAKPLTRTPAVMGDKDVRHFFSLSVSL
jgi:hemolysin activation/secretion protein